MAGVKVPLVAMHHAYVVTERIEGIQASGSPGLGVGCRGAQGPRHLHAARPCRLPQHPDLSRLGGEMGTLGVRVA